MVSEPGVAKKKCDKLRKQDGGVGVPEIVSGGGFDGFSWPILFKKK